MNAKNKTALITGITGQDGSYLAEFLLAKGYTVHGIIRRSSTFNTQRIDHIYVDPHEKNPRFFLHYGDMSDPGMITEMLWKIQPDEIYHLAAQSHVRVSFDMPEYTGDITGLGTTRILEALRRSGGKAKFYQASSSELFGSAPAPQNENTPFRPQSPYAAAKLYAYWMTVNYRQSYGLFACNGILFNHESPRRGETFVTRKITRAAAAILSGRQDRLFLGNLDAKRDWGFAPEYVEMMWLMLQQKTAEDFAVGTGESHSIREFVERTFAYAGVEIGWSGRGKKELGKVKSMDGKKLAALGGVKLKTGQTIVEIDPRYFRPSEVDCLRADTRKAAEKLGWKPRVTFADLVRVMADYDFAAEGLKSAGEGMRACSEKGFSYTKHQTSLRQR